MMSDYEYRIKSFPRGAPDLTSTTTSLATAERKYAQAVEDGAFPILYRRELLPWETVKNAANSTPVKPAVAGLLITIETSGPGKGLALHLGAPSGTGVGPCLCGFDRHARDENGQGLVGFSVGGGTSGPGVKHLVCGDCERLADGRRIHGTNAALFPDLVGG